MCEGNEQMSSVEWDAFCLDSVSAMLKVKCAFVYREVFLSKCIHSLHVIDDVCFLHIFYKKGHPHIPPKYEYSLKFLGIVTVCHYYSKI